MNRIVIKRSLLGWFRWHWRTGGKTICYSTRRFRRKDQAWNDAKRRFGQEVYLLDDRSQYPEEHSDLYAGPRDFDHN